MTWHRGSETWVPFSSLYLSAQLLRYPRRDVSPKLATGASAALPGVRVDESKVIRDARVQAEVVGIVRRHWNDFNRTSRRIEVHLDM